MAPPRPRPAPEPSGGDRRHHGLPAGRGPGRAHGRRPDGGRTAGAHPRRRAGRGTRDDRGGTGGGDVPGRDEAGDRPRADPMTERSEGPYRPVPGEILFGDGPVVINAGRSELTLTVTNTGDRPVQVGSHYHFAETNKALEFDRDAADGHRLGIPAGTSVRFEPGIARDVTLVPLAGNRVVPGLWIKS